MKKILVSLLCALLVMTATVGAFPKQVKAGGVIDAIVAFVAAPVLLLDPLTSLVIVDAFTCEINIIWGCDKNGDPLPEPLPIVTLDAPATVELPNPIELNWTANARAVSCEASGDWSGDKVTTGSQKVVNVTDPSSLGVHTYTLTCKNSEGGEASVTASTTVIGPSAAITAPATVEVPNPVSVNWSSQNAVACAASGDWSGAKGISGSETVLSPTNAVARGAHTYNLACSNASGYAANASAMVNVIQVPKCTIGADPSSITPPQSSTLSWSCQYANSCSIDRGIGAVNAVSGTRRVAPSASATYTLTCQGADGARSFSAGVTVGGGMGRIQEVNP